MQVTCPAGAGPGSAVQVQGPGGFPFQATVPAGVGPGQTFHVRMLADPPPLPRLARETAPMPAGSETEAFGAIIGPGTMTAGSQIARSRAQIANESATIIVEHLPPSSCLCFVSQPRKRGPVKVAIDGGDERTIPQGASATWSVQPGLHVAKGTTAKNPVEKFYRGLGDVLGGVDSNIFESSAHLEVGQTATFEVGWEQRGSSRWYTYIASPEISSDSHRSV